MFVFRLFLTGVLLSVAASSAVILDNTYLFTNQPSGGRMTVEVLVEDHYLGNPDLRNWRYEVHNIDFVPFNHGFPTVPRGFVLPWEPSPTGPGCTGFCGFEIHTPPGWFFAAPNTGSEFPGAWTSLSPAPGLPVGSNVEFGFATTSQGIVHRSTGTSVFAIDPPGPGDQAFGEIDVPSTPSGPIPEPSTFLILCGTLSLGLLSGAWKRGAAFLRAQQ